MKRFIRMSFAVAVILLGIRCSYAFDIAVYFDARSGVNWRCQNPGQYFCGDVLAPRETVLGRINSEQQVFDWFHEMGVTHMITYYPFSSDLTDLHSRELHGMKILNASYPGEAFKYLEAQNREIPVWDEGNIYVNDDGSSWKSPIIDSTCQQLPVVQRRDLYADTMWRPESDLGVWNGWNRREAGISQDIYMTMHYVITCNLVPTNPPPPSGQPIFTFYWLVKNTEGSGWWRYPGFDLMAGDFQTGPDSLDVFEINFTPSQGSGTFVLLDDNFQPTAQSADSHSYGTLDENVVSRSHAFGTMWGVPVRMCVYYHGGNQTFQIYNISIWDEGYDRLFKASNPTRQYWANVLSTAFSNQRTSAGGDTTFAGWYYDEWPQGPTMWQTEMLEPWTRVNQILNQAGLPAMWLNGQFGWPGCTNCYRNLVFKTGHDYGVTCPIHMDEFYFLGGRRTCDDALGWMYTDTSSDVAYFHVVNTCGTDTVQAEKSLQCAIDEHLWGDSVLIENYPVVSSAWQGIRWGLLDQISFVHDSSGGSKFWAMIQGDDDNYQDADDPNGNCVIRQPTPNECKLSAWLSVAMDADGILWYPVSFAAGLLKWSNDFADTCGNPAGLQQQPVGVETTDRYYAAKEVGNDIQQRVAPILDNLEFVKTYASRAFERNYPDSIYAATAFDTLADHVWCGYPIRAVQAIRSYEPCSYMDSACFMDGAEWRSYVQVSRFRNKHIPELDPYIEDYWFLVVNRRALSDEWRKIELDIPVIYDGPYYVRYVLGDSTKLLPISVNREEDCHLQTITLILKPGEAELVHFTHGEYGCADAAANVSGLTAIYTGNDAIRLRWEEPTMTEDSLPFTPQTYFILRSQDDYEGPYDTIAFTETNTYLDSLALPQPRGFYMVHACGTITERPAGSPIEKPVAPKKVEVVSGTKLSNYQKKLSK